MSTKASMVNLLAFLLEYIGTTSACHTENCSSFGLIGLLRVNPLSQCRHQ